VKTEVKFTHQAIEMHQNTRTV